MAAPKLDNNQASVYKEKGQSQGENLYPLDLPQEERNGDDLLQCKFRGRGTGGGFSTDAWEGCL